LLFSLAPDSSGFQKLGVEDWELFFQQKSQRRADRVRRQKLIRIGKQAALALAALAAIAGYIQFTN
jgi:hypothetical protein